jgi:hypothetical protein
MMIRSSSDHQILDSFIPSVLLNNYDGYIKGRVSGDLEGSDIRGPAEQSPFPGDELSAGCFG